MLKWGKLVGNILLFLTLKYITSLYNILNEGEIANAKGSIYRNRVA